MNEHKEATFDVAKIRELAPELNDSAWPDAELGVAWLKFSKAEFSEKDGIAVTDDTVRRFKMWLTPDELPEIKDLKGQLKDVTDKLTLAGKAFDSVTDQLGKTIAAKNDAYDERARVVAAYAKLLAALGYKVGVGRHEPEGDPEWAGWETVLYIDLPSGQVSWHYSDAQALELLADVPEYHIKWDKHTTQEKYNRLKNFAPARMQKERVQGQMLDLVKRMSQALDEIRQEIGE